MGGDCSQSEDEDETEAGSGSDDEPAGGRRLGRQAQAAARGAERGVPALMMVPREAWPDEPCDELRGAGWLVEVVKRAGKADAAKALCRFVAG